MSKSFIVTEWGGTCYPMTVHEHVGVKTGLLDASGREIIRQPNPVGFVTDFQQAKPVVRVKAGSQKL